MPPTRKREFRATPNTPRSLVRTRTNSKTKRRPSPKNLAKKLTQIRDDLGLSQSEIAARLGVDNRASISGYERGEREPPLPTLLAYTRLAGVSVECLIDDEMKLPMKRCKKVV